VVYLYYLVFLAKPGFKPLFEDHGLDPESLKVDYETRGFPVNPNFTVVTEFEQIENNYNKEISKTTTYDTL